jgi:hypothetical protein
MTPHPEYDGDEARLPLEWVLCCDLTWTEDGLGQRWQIPTRFWVEDRGGNAIAPPDFEFLEEEQKFLREFVAEKSAEFTR